MFNIVHNTHFILLHFVSFYSIVFLLCFIWELHHMNTNDWNHNQKLQVYWWLVNLIKKDVCAFCLVEPCMQLCSTQAQKRVHSTRSRKWCRQVLVVGEAGVPGENHRPRASNWQTFSTCGCESSAPFFCTWVEQSCMHGSTKHML
jgi:hypothetical protein